MRSMLMLLLLALMTMGCNPNRGMHPPYYGDTLPLDKVVEKINAQNSRIDSLRCDGTFSADLIDPKTGEKTSGSGDLTLLYMPKRNLRLAGRLFGDRLFDIYSNEDRYWMALPRQQTMYWGNHRFTGSLGGGMLPVRPDLLTEVLSVGVVEPDFLKEPCPVVRFNNDQDCYMVTWQVLLSDRWVVQKEVWYDRETLRPRSVLLFDGSGRIVLRAYLLNPKPVDGFDPAISVPSDYLMFFPETGSTFDIHLKELERKHNGVPTAASFKFPGDTTGISKVIQIDE